jgi:hypothetical protein
MAVFRRKNTAIPTPWMCIRGIRTTSFSKLSEVLAVGAVNEQLYKKKGLSLVLRQPLFINIGQMPCNN